MNRLRLVALLVVMFGPATGRFLHAQDAASATVKSFSGPLQAVVDGAVAATLEKFSARKLQSNQIAVTLVDLRDLDRPVSASHRGGEAIYPASVVKLFYLVAAHRWLEDGRLEDTPELRRAMRDMIVLSYNEATHYVLDLLTGTTSGPELPPADLEAWHDRRNAVNRHFASLGYTNINASKKPWCEGPYGRETQAIRQFKPNRNLLTTDATARLLTEIATGKAVNPGRCKEMMKLLSRNLKEKPSEEGQVTGFTGQGLPAGAALWSKAGWTSQTRHDAAYVELPDGGRFVLVTFSTDHAREAELIPFVTREVVKRMREGR